MKTAIAAAVLSALGTLPPAFGIAGGARSQAVRPGGPPVPYVDVGACPFEGCVYREWTANDRLVVRKQRRADSAIVYSVRKGEQVTALTGVVVTVRPGRVQFRRSVDLDTASGRLHIASGQTLFLLTYRGEGTTKAWFQGRVYDDVDGGMAFFNARCEDAHADCDGRITVKPQSVWWVQIRNRRGQMGWTNEPEKFDGTDRFGG